MGEGNAQDENRQSRRMRRTHKPSPWRERLGWESRSSEVKRQQHLTHAQEGGEKGLHDCNFTLFQSLAQPHFMLQKYTTQTGEKITFQSLLG